MHWHQERQRLLAENVANSDTPNFRPRDLAPPSFERSVLKPQAALTLALTDQQHLAGVGAAGTASGFAAERGSHFNIRPGGNAVSLEDEMMKVAANQMDYQAAATLYGRSLALLKTALGKR
jgi:flagellar basal-body rod protein FlgB